MKGQVWQHMPVTLALGRQRQKDSKELEAGSSSETEIEPNQLLC